MEPEASLTGGRTAGTRRTRGTDGDPVFQLQELLFADAPHIHEIFDPLEGTVFLAKLENALCSRRPNARQFLQVLQRRLVQVDLAVLLRLRPEGRGAKQKCQDTQHPGRNFFLHTVLLVAFLPDSTLESENLQRFFSETAQIPLQQKISPESGHDCAQSQEGPKRQRIAPFFSQDQDEDGTHQSTHCRAQKNG